MNDKTINEWAKIINESSDNDSFDDDYDMRSEYDSKIAYDQYNEAIELLGQLDFTDKETRIDFVTFLTLFKKLSLDNVLNSIKVVSNEKDKDKFQKFFKLIDYYTKNLSGPQLKDFVKNGVYESDGSGDGTDDAMVQKIVMAMDYFGWEQDGEGTVFINVGGDGERREFDSWDDVLDFAKDLIQKENA